MQIHGTYTITKVVQSLRDEKETRLKPRSHSSQPNSLRNSSIKISNNRLWSSSDALARTLVNLKGKGMGGGRAGGSEVTMGRGSGAGGGY